MNIDMRTSKEIYEELNSCIEWGRTQRIAGKTESARRSALLVKILKWVVEKNRNTPQSEVDHAISTQMKYLDESVDVLALVDDFVVRPRAEILEALVTTFEFSNIYLRALMRSEGELSEEQKFICMLKFSMMQDASGVLSWVLQRAGGSTPSILLTGTGKPPILN